MAYTTNTFQFLNGTIITPILHSVSVLSLCFNSSMVRLLQCARIRYPPQSGVSIPQWYDYYAKRLRVIRV